MNDHFTDRLLDESLRQYSRVAAPEGFAARLGARQSVGEGAWGTRKSWWMLAPVAAALGLTLLLLRPAPLPTEPERIAMPLPHPPSQVLHPPTRVLHPPSPRPGFRILSGEELARLDLPDELFARPEARPVKDLEVPDLKIPSLAGSEETGNKEP